METCAPGAVIFEIARQFDIVSSMIYKWRCQEVANHALAFFPAVVDNAQSSPNVPPAPVAITIEFSAGVRVTIDTAAPIALVTAALLALQ